MNRTGRTWFLALALALAALSMTQSVTAAANRFLASKDARVPPADLSKSPRSRSRVFA